MFDTYIGEGSSASDGTVLELLLVLRGEGNGNAGAVGEDAGAAGEGAVGLGGGELDVLGDGGSYAWKSMSVTGRTRVVD